MRNKEEIKSLMGRLERIWLEHPDCSIVEIFAALAEVPDGSLRADEDQFKSNLVKAERFRHNLLLAWYEVPKRHHSDCFWKGIERGFKTALAFVDGQEEVEFLCEKESMKIFVSCQFYMKNEKALAALCFETLLNRRGSGLSMVNRTFKITGDFEKKYSLAERILLPDLDNGARKRIEDVWYQMREEEAHGFVNALRERL